MNLWDDSEYQRWVDENRKKQEVETLEHRQITKIEMEMAWEEAIEARQSKTKQNQLLVQKEKLTSEQLLAELEKEKEEDLKVKEELVGAIHDQWNMAQDKVQEAKVEKRKIRDEVNQELQDAFQRKKEEEALDLERKQELIRQIRELEKIPLVRSTGFDPTESAGHGLLGEMSIAELWEWLEYENIRWEVETDDKRAKILEDSEEHAEEIAWKAKRVHDARNKLKQ